MFSNVLDSRSVGLGDAFGQRFMKAGKFPYEIVRGGGRQMVIEHSHEIIVKDSDSEEMKQHTVLVTSEGRALVGDQRRLEIATGDLVVWACVSDPELRFQIVGRKDFFSSAALTTECGYSHAFGLPGDYHWIDANGGEARGVVRVKQVKSDGDADIERWKKRLAKAKLVMINDGKVEPSEVTIEVGQTVYFAVVKTEPMTITDIRQLRAEGKPVKEDG